MRTFSRPWSLTLALALALAAVACSSKSEPGPPPAKAPAVVKRVATPAETLSPDLVTAVTTGKNGASMLQVKFELRAKPEVGDPVDVDLVIVPQVDNIDSISGTVQGEDGLEVVSGDAVAPAEKPAFGTPIHRDLKVRAKRDGIFTLSVAMAVESGGQTLSPVYTIPVIAGNGLVDTGAAAVPGRGGSKPPGSPAAK